MRKTEKQTFIVIFPLCLAIVVILLTDSTGIDPPKSYGAIQERHAPHFEKNRSISLDTTVIPVPLFTN